MKTVSIYCRREFWLYMMAGLSMIAFTILAYCIAWSKPVDFWSLIGTGTGITGILITLEQTLQTKSAAIMASLAADKVANEMKEEYHRLCLLEARRVLGEALAFIDTKTWDRASLRLRDLSDWLSRTAANEPDDEDWDEARRAMQQWASIFARGIPTRSFDFKQIEWTNWRAFLQQKIDLKCRPFSG